MLRTHFAALAARSVNAISRILRQGSGTVAGGRVALKIDPRFLAKRSDGHSVVLVSGTNGKTTSTALVAAALREAGSKVVSNETGSNMPAGHAAALTKLSGDAVIVLETDEPYLAHVAQATQAGVIVLLNLSRDQLDRSNEVRMLAERWKAMVDLSSATVVANADDPLVAWAASEAKSVIWVGAGLAWREDARSCPWCAGLMNFADDGAWSCSCGKLRPACTIELESGANESDSGLSLEGKHFGLQLALPGRFNQGNAALALGAAKALGIDIATAIKGMESLQAVAGRFSTISLAGRQLQLLLAKNPAGWAALLTERSSHSGPLVLALNARIADGADPSWIYDVPFELLRGKQVAVTGDRRHDLSVRLFYADVAHEVAKTPVLALEAIAPLGASVEFIGNYTAFHELAGGSL